LERQDVREIGRNEDGASVGLPDFSTGITVEAFQAGGKVWVDQERLKMCKRKSRPAVGRCRRRGYVTWSGPEAREEERWSMPERSSGMLKGEQKEEWVGPQQEEERKVFICCLP
jgi:hypothetical protein